VNPTELAVALDYFSPAIELHLETNSVFFPIGGSVHNSLLVFDANTGARLSDQIIPTSGPSNSLLIHCLLLIGRRDSNNCMVRRHALER
jgi:hypothetical protein